GGSMIVAALSHAKGARLDRASGRMELMYSAAQGFYRESLEKSPRATALGQALQSVYGKPIAVAFARVEGSGAPAAPKEIRAAAGAARPAPAPSPAPNRSSVSGEARFSLPPSPSQNASRSSAPAVMEEEGETE